MSARDFVPPASAIDSVGDETARSVAFQLGVLQSLIEQVLTDCLTVDALRTRYTELYPNWAAS